MMFGTTSALAQEKGENATAFESGNIQEQLELDLTPVPAGMGALFVPSLTDSATEPVVMVFQGKQRVAKARTGRRIVLPPGNYQVMVGGSDPATHASFNAQVREGVTQPLPAFFGAVRVQTTDEDGRPVVLPYVITDTSGKRVFASSKTAKSPAYSKTRSHLLPSGDYKLVVGDREDSNVMAFRVTDGDILRYRVVTDDGRVLRTEFADKQIIVKPEIFKLRWVVGADASLNNTRRQLATFNGEALRIGVFTNANLGLDVGNHLLLFTLDVQESWTGLDSRFGRGLPLQKLLDDVDANLLYNYRLGGILGPYVHASVDTALFPTNLYTERDSTVLFEDANGDVNISNVEAGETINLFDAFYPTHLQQGAGLGMSFISNEVVSLSLRAGAAARQSFYNDGSFMEAFTDQQVRLLRLTDKRLYGAEATAMFGLRLGDTLFYDARGNLFVPQDQIFGDDDYRPVYEIQNTVTLSLGRFASLVFDSTIHRDDIQIEKNQYITNLSLRLQHTLF